MLYEYKTNLIRQFVRRANNIVVMNENNAIHNPLLREKVDSPFDRGTSYYLEEFLNGLPNSFTQFR